eukprot:1161968-Pelagomonas_calceolata.AAC.11
MPEGPVNSLSPMSSLLRRSRLLLVLSRQDICIAQSAEYSQVSPAETLEHVVQAPLSEQAHKQVG